VILKSFLLKHTLNTIIIISAVILISGCSSTRKLKENQALVHKNKIVGVNSILKDDLNSYVRQKPNTKSLLGLVKPKLFIYNTLNQNKNTRINRWLRTKIAEPPVIYDSSIAIFSAQQMELYLFNKGYFNAVVKPTVLVKRKKAYITYRINQGPAYTIRNIQYKIKDTILQSIYFYNLAESKIKLGDVFDQDKIQEERNRITKDIKNFGYFFFNREYIHFDFDSAIAGNIVDMKVVIENPTGKKAHQAYDLNKVEISLNGDESYAKFRRTDTTDAKFIQIIDPQNILKPKIIRRQIYLNKKGKYNDDDLDLTYNRLGDLRMFKFVNIDFAIDSVDTTKLNTYISLKTSKKQFTQTEIEGYVASANLGSSANFIYTNNNIFRGAEIFEFRIKAGLETQAFIDENTSNIPLFNSRESNISSSITFPGFLLFRDKKTYGIFASPRTRLGVNYIIEQRPEYIRNTFSGNFTYDWKQNQHVTHSFSPLSLNFVRSTLSTEALDLLNNLNNQYIKESFDPHITLGLRYTLTYSNQVINLPKDYYFMRFNLEVMGTGLYGLSKIISAVQNTSGNYELFGLPYYNFTRPEIDLRYFNFIGQHSSVVFRFNTGAGFAYWNSNILPFERQFFTGGSNSIRAFRARTVGPGNFADIDVSNLNLDQTGEMKIEGNIEYRFDITDHFLGSKLKGASFIDAGNVWSLSKANIDPTGKFQWDSFYKQFAIGTGAGLRLDYSFLLFRFDLGLKIRDPRFSGADQWVIQNIGDSQWVSSNQYNFWNFNFGIGYPF
jgi:outer membrane protein insertion porin family